jgi:type II secretory pathway pseudopilin PulG
MEMLVVVMILVILAGVGGVSYFKYLDNARKDTAKIQIKMLTEECKRYKTRFGDFPPSLAALAQPDPEGGPPSLDDPNVLKSPWGTPYGYDASGSNNRGLKPDIWVDSPVGRIGNW